MRTSDVIVVGAGMVGAAIALGLAWRGLKVVAVDGDDGDFRASRANFGLVSVQGKGLNMPPYQRLTRQSADDWAGFAARLRDESAIDVRHDRRGMLVFCHSPDDLEARRLHLTRLHNQLGGEPADFELLDRGEVERMLPGTRLGADVCGATFGRSDGTCNPLYLLSATHRAFLRAGGTLLRGHAVARIAAAPGGGFVVEAGGEPLGADRLVIAAGIATGDLARAIDLDVPVRPQRGQLLVTERLAPMLPYPASGLRQMPEGTMMIGLTNEEVGPDTSVTAGAARHMSRRAIRILPDLARATVVRQWAGLRVMPRDGFPVYAESPTHPGGFVAACHSGVTLAAAHAGPIAAAIAAGQFGDDLAPFHSRRFDVPKAA